MSVIPKTTDGCHLDEKRRNQLVADYVQSAGYEQKIIQFLAVLYEPPARVTLMNCLNALGFHNREGKPFDLISLEEDLKPLLNSQLVVEERHLGPRCHPLLREVALWDTLPDRFERMVAVIEEYRPRYIPWGKKQPVYQSALEFVRDVRLAFYQNNLEKMRQCDYQFQTTRGRYHKISLEEIVREICRNPWDSDLIADREDPALQALCLRSLLDDSLIYRRPADEAFALLRHLCENHLDAKAIPERVDLMCLYVEQLLLRGYPNEAKIALIIGACSDTPEPFEVFDGWLHLVEGNVEDSLNVYRAALQAELKVRKKRKGFFQGLCGSLFILALLKEGSASSVQEALRYLQPLIDDSEPHPFESVLKPLYTWACLQQGDLSAKKTLFSRLQSLSPLACHPLGVLLHALCVYWVQPGAKKTLTQALEPLYVDIKDAGYEWLALEAVEVLARVHPKSDYPAQAAQLRQEIPLPPLADLMPTQATWQLQLQALRNLYAPEEEAESPRSTDRRLIWLFTYQSSISWTLQPREQKLSAKGNWSKGRNVSLKRLKQELEDFDYLTAQDIEACDSLLRNSYRDRHKGGENYYFSRRAMLALVGHPLIFDESSGVRLEILKGDPELRVLKTSSKTLTLEFFPPPDPDQNLLLLQESPTRFKLVQISENHRQIAQILGTTLEVPTSAVDEVLESVQAISHVVTVQSDIGGGNHNLESVPSVATPHVHLLPAGDGLKVALLCRPFGEAGPYYQPGQGGQLVIAELDGTRQQTERDLAAEKDQADCARLACPTLAANDDSSGEWQIDDPEACLELLMELQALGNSVIVEWPEGEKLRICRQVGLGQLHLQVGQQKDWFAASGEIQVSEEQVLQIQQLLALLEQTPSRFVPLGEGQFLALTQTFRKRLDDLRAFSEIQKKGIRFHPLASLALEEMMEAVGSLKADKHWKAHCKTLKAAQTLDPQVPSTLQAELRDYQQAGFEWLARLAHWGVGACLADDMGLGKTLQALAVILTRAPKGPTLVVAPTSVGTNWIIEAQKFAPTLNPILLGSVASTARQSTLDTLKSFDLLICTYGLLQQPDVSTMLAQVEWQTIVLDEAQAIKNSATKRSQAAMKLQGGFKLIMTGTPIENHLGELWNQFRFINPGLLGSNQQFNQRFASPIERQQDKAARQQLKKLIQPFILRRTKNQVLEELPSRTEITLTVELSAEEKALYEAVRRDAVEKLTESEADAGPQSLQILAEIMKLRRLCCNARLVMPKTTLRSSKLQVFSEVLEDLLANHHKALVFSQFVDHLTLIRHHLEEQNIHYQYLDGSTSTQQRHQRVEAFQAGEGDVFLISLKAGGTGLNLTAADYVIHMDPWWNPAVEDQASDRAHRIGQQRPVTIYRLVAQGTIEEKIVELHRHKRDLADSLLEGADSSGKLSTDELLRLIRED